MVNLKNILFLGVTALLVVFLELHLLQPVFSVGLTPEDREFILAYKALGENPLSKMLEVWSQKGAYTTMPIYYLGVVESFIGFNYQFILYVGIFFRTLAALSILVLVMIVFKNRWLAVLTTIFFAISYTTTGALETGVQPSEYLGLLMMNIFLIAYYYLDTKYPLRLRWLFLASLLLFIAVITSVMRVYPILVLLPIIEIFLWFFINNRYKVRYLLFKLLILYLPFLVLIYYFPVSPSGHFSLPLLVSEVGRGNWHLVLTPLQGLGFIIPFSKYYQLLGRIDLSNFQSYMQFLSGGPLFLFGTINLVLFLISVNKVYFFLRVFIINFGFQVLTYWVSQHSLLMSVDIRRSFDTNRLYPVFFGIYILTLAINYFIEWLRMKRDNNLFLALWLGPFVGLFFILMTYFFASLNLSFGGAQDHYLLIPTFGVSLFLAALLLLLKHKLSNSLLQQWIGIALITFVIFIFYVLNKELVYNYFNTANINGRAAAGQLEMQVKVKNKLEDFNNSRPMLVYFDTSDIPSESMPFYSESLLTPLPFFMHLQDDKVIDGCIGVIYENSSRVKLRNALKEDDNQQVIMNSAICVDDYGLRVKNVLFKMDNFYAFKIKDRDLIDIKDQIIKEIELK